MSLDYVIASRRGVRDAYRDEILTLATGELEQVPGGSWDGVPVLTEPKLIELVHLVFDRDPPAPSSHHAEVSTPASVAVSAICPRCSLPSLVLVSIVPELVVDDQGAAIRVKVKTKAAAHVCGQLSIDATGADNTQMGFDELPAGTALGVDELLDLLSLVRDHFEADDFPTRDEIDGWTEPQREAVQTWATTAYGADEGAEIADFPDLDARTSSGGSG